MNVAVSKIGFDAKVPPSKLKWRITKITISQNTKRTYGKLNEQLSPKCWPLSYLSLTKYHLVTQLKTVQKLTITCNPSFLAKFKFDELADSVVQGQIKICLKRDFFSLFVPVMTFRTVKTCIRYRLILSSDPAICS